MSIGRHPSSIKNLNVTTLKVKLHGKKVGMLAKSESDGIAFAYADEWIECGFSISPFSLPLDHRVRLGSLRPFDGLFGVFSDSMPDGWGRLLVDRMLKAKGVDPYTVDSLARLAIVGTSGMGALEYEPEYVIANYETSLSLDEIAQECKEILQNEDPSNLDELFLMGGSSGGARPKVLVELDDEDWIVKFPSSMDAPNIGRLEYELALKAKSCGIEMPEVQLMSSNICDGYFATKRFDRYVCDGEKKKLHMASAGALLETSHRIPNLDYDLLLKLTMLLTDDVKEVKRMFSLMTFNVYAGNRDDHAKNFSFLCSDTGKWSLSPAYDLTENRGIHGEHATTVNGKGKEIVDKDIIEVGKRVGLSNSFVNNTIATIQECFQKRLN